MKTKRLLIFLAVLILLIDLAYFYPILTGEVIKNPEYRLEEAFCTRIIDGDTIEIEINKSSQTVRLLGVNTPEKKKPYYNEAKSFLKKIENKTIYVLRDVEDEDKYNRLLRYVFYNNQLINEKILENGLANVYIYEELFYQEKFERAEQKAKQQERGLWKKSEGKCAECIELIELNPIEEFFILKNNCNLPCNNLEAKDEANHFFKINLEVEEQKTIKSKGKVWNNDGDSLFLRDESGLLIYHQY